jgi:hypothetical protein
MKDDLQYSTSDCFDTFPFPGDAEQLILESSGEQFYLERARQMSCCQEGLTLTHNRMNNPGDISSDTVRLRELYEHLNAAVRNAYGWSEINTACGFGLDYLDTEDDAQLPDELQERIDSGELFFWDAGDALDFQGQLEAYGAISGRRKLPWRYRWPDAVRDDVLARLLALNAERYAEEVAQGLHSKGSKKAAGPAAPGGKRRGRSPKSAQAGETEARQAEQMGLVL